MLCLGAGYLIINPLFAKCTVQCNIIWQCCHLLIPPLVCGRPNTHPSPSHIPRFVPNPLSALIILAITSLFDLPASVGRLSINTNVCNFTIRLCKVGNYHFITCVGMCVNSFTPVFLLTSVWVVYVCLKHYCIQIGVFVFIHLYYYAV